MRCTTQPALAQKASTLAALTTPPAATGSTSCVAPSVERLTWYSGPAYAAYMARTAECAATHGVPPAARMSQGPDAAATPLAPSAAAPTAERRDGMAWVVG
jgi:hypothetical protein